MSGNDNSSIFRLWENVSLSIEVLSVNWDSLTKFNDSFLKVTREAAEVSILMNSIRSCWRIRRTLLSTPVRPSFFDNELHQIEDDCLRFVNATEEHGASRFITSLARACADLAGSDNPLIIEVEKIGSQYNRTGLLLSDESLRAPVQDLLDEFELDGIVVLSAKQMRKFDSPEIDAFISIGNPQQTFSHSSATAKSDSQRSGWLITSPPAMKTFIIETSLSKSISIDNLWLLDGIRPDIEIIQNEDFERRAEEPDMTDIAFDQSSELYPSGAGLSHRISCLCVRFQSGRRAYFPDSKFGAPRIIDIDESGKIELVRIRARNLAPGFAMLLQGNRSETEEIRDRAIQILLKLGVSQDEIDNVLMLVANLKHRLAEVLEASGNESLENRLISSGLESGYAKYLTSAPLHPEYIAPTKGFNQFMTSIDLVEAINSKPRIEMYRGACRRAGRRLDLGLVHELNADPNWEDRLDTDGSAVIELRDSGTLIVERISEIGGAVEVTASQIGKSIGDAKWRL
jgi:hypothetical protein